MDNKTGIGNRRGAGEEATRTDGQQQGGEPASDRHPTEREVGGRGRRFRGVVGGSGRRGAEHRAMRGCPVLRLLSLCTLAGGGRPRLFPRARSALHRIFRDAAHGNWASPQPRRHITATAATPRPSSSRGRRRGRRGPPGAPAAPRRGARPRSRMAQHARAHARTTRARREAGAEEEFGRHVVAGRGGRWQGGQVKERRGGGQAVVWWRPGARKAPVPPHPHLPYRAPPTDAPPGSPGVTSRDVEH